MQESVFYVFLLRETTQPKGQSNCLVFCLKQGCFWNLLSIVNMTDVWDGLGALLTQDLVLSFPGSLRGFLMHLPQHLAVGSEPGLASCSRVSWEETAKTFSPIDFLSIYLMCQMITPVFSVSFRGIAVHPKLLCCFEQSLQQIASNWCVWLGCWCFFCNPMPAAQKVIVRHVYHFSPWNHRDY